MRRFALKVPSLAWIALVFGLMAGLTTASNADTPKEFALKRLESQGLRKAFIHKLLRTRPEANEQRWVELNILGFLKKGDYDAHYSESGLRSTANFLKKYESTFRRMEKATEVPREIVASLIWVETKHGRHRGDVPIIPAFLALAGADHPERLQSTLTALKNEVGTGEKYRESILKVVERSMTKARWAIDQLKALDKMNVKGIDVFRLRGSYAGAFGLGQFIPTSYMDWAVSARKGRRPDLFDEKDAILSVGNFLKAHGWSDRAEDRKKALYEYNRAFAYGEVILRIADDVKKVRSPAKSDQKPALSQPQTSE